MAFASFPDLVTNISKQDISHVSKKLMGASYHHSPTMSIGFIGFFKKMRFAGESLAVDANGKLLKKANGKEALLLVDVVMQQAKKARALRPYLSLRRTGLYL